VPVRELAAENEVPKRFLEHIMLGLKEQGWVESSPGRLGGYVLAQSPDRITMGQVVRHFDGGFFHFQQGPNTRRCRFRQALLHVRNLIAEYLDNLTLAQLV
jgi:Rrf2 family protein